MRRHFQVHDPVPGAVVAWLFAFLFFVITMVFARLVPVASAVPAWILVVALVPRLVALRTMTVFGLALAWLLLLVPALSLGESVSCTLFFGSLALVSTQIAREEGAGEPIRRWLQSPRTRGFGAVLWGSLWTTGGLFSICSLLERPELAPQWQWAWAPIALLVLLPSQWVGGTNRCVVATPLFLAALCYWGANPNAKGPELLLQGSWNVFMTLAGVGVAHEGWTKFRTATDEARSNESRGAASP